MMENATSRSLCRQMCVGERALLCRLVNGGRNGDLDTLTAVVVDMMMRFLVERIDGCDD